MRTRIESRSGVYRRMIVSARWRRLRAQVLQAHPLCQECERAGRVRAAAEVHHVTPVDSVPTVVAKEALMYAPSNLVSLCHRCHMAAHRELGKNDYRQRKEREREQLEAFYAEMFGESDGTKGSNGNNENDA